jgi:hypothetical protein
MTKHTYIQTSTITEIITQEKCGHLEVPHTLPIHHDVLSAHPSLSQELSQAK